MQPRNSSRFWFIPGFQQLHKGQTIPGIAWLIGTLVGFAINSDGYIWSIIYLIYLYLYCKNEVMDLWKTILKAKSRAKQSSKDKRIDKTDQTQAKEKSEVKPDVDVETSLDFPHAKNTIGCMVGIIDDYVVIRKGKKFQVLNFFDQDANEVKIPVESLTCVNYKASGMLDGTLEFVYMGFVPKPNQIKHAQENVITFRGEECNQKFLEFKEVVEKRMREIRRESQNPQKSSISDELSKLSDLYEKGILTEEEFTMQKKKILEM